MGYKPVVYGPKMREAFGVFVFHIFSIVFKFAIPKLVLLLLAFSQQG
jgi:hypothetical protein